MTRLDSSKCGYMAKAISVQIAVIGDRPGVAVPANGGGLPAVAPRCARTAGAALGRGDQDDVEAARPARELRGGGGSQPRAPAAPLGRADDHPRGVARLRVFEQRFGGRRTVERHRLGTERLGEAQHLDAAVALALREPQQRRRLDVDHGPFGIERVRDALAGAHQLLGLLIRPDRHQHPVARRARLRAIGGQLARSRLDPVRHPAQRDLAQRHQVLLAEEALDGGAGLARDVHLAGVQPRDQVIGRQIDELDCRRPRRTRDRAASRAGGCRWSGDEVVQALEMLDVHGRPDAHSRLRAAPRRPASAWDGAARARRRRDWNAPARRPAGSAGWRSSAASRSNSCRTMPR